MATYKVIQDVEAEDKLVGPLTFRQFVYMGVAGICIYLMYFVAANGAAFLAIPIFPFALVAGFFAFPWGKEQPTELWALARIRFLFKPRLRIWDQSGAKELVTITVPKRVEQIYTDGLSQREVRSRLHALATTIDSRGWAIKDPIGNPYSNPSFNLTATSNDRLIGVEGLQQGVPEIDQDSFTDMLNPNNNRVADQFAALLNENEKNHRAELVASMQQQAIPPTQPQLPSVAPQDNTPADYWFLNQNDQTTQNNGNSTFSAQVVAPGMQDAPTTQQTTSAISPDEEQALVEQLKANEPLRSTAVYSHLPTILPLSEQERLAKEQAADQPQQTSTTTQTDTTQATNPSVTDQPDAAILDLSRNDDLNIETIARQAKKAHGDDEVVISLH